MREPRLRLILCDVDGTLLEKGANGVPEAVFTAIRQAVKAGFRFVISSGRTYTDLENLFFSVKEIVTFVCNDGALAVENGKILYSAPVDIDFVNKVLNDITLSGGETFVAYSKDKEYRFDADATSGLSGVRDDVYKIAFRYQTASTKEKFKNRAVRSGKLSLVYSDAQWTEYIRFNVDKGTAAEMLQKHYGISEAETVAFGDNTNDIGMLRRARVSVSSPSAIPDVERICKYRATDVVDAIFKITEEGEKYE